MRRRKRFLPVLLALAAAAVPPGAQKHERTPKLKNWIDGPIRYVSERAETQAFRSLTRDQDRVLFIERFWARRDPHPETMTNEYRQIFWERVREANDTFLDSAHEGWRTDRGKIHILYGPPSDIEEDLDFRADANTSIGGIIRWIYDGRVGNRTDVNPITVVPFVRGPGGEFRISYEPKLSSVFFDANAMVGAMDEAVDRWIEVSGMPGRTELSVMLDLGKLQEVPPQAQILLERIETRESYLTYNVIARVDRFGHPEFSTEWMLSISVDISTTIGRDVPAIIARFRPLANVDLDDGAKDLRILDEASFKVEEHEETRVAQARIRLAPGEYELTLLVADSDTGETGLLRKTLNLGPLSERFRFSDVVLAEDLQTLRYRSLSSYNEPFTVGPFRVVPRFDEQFHPGDKVKLFYEVYKADLPLKVSYQVQGRDDDGSWVNLGAAAEAMQEHNAQAWELATSERWPLGEYRIRVDVLDNAGKQISTNVPFELAAVQPSDSEERAR